MGQAEATGKDYSLLASRPSSSSSFNKRTSGSEFHREGDKPKDDFLFSPGNMNKASHIPKERNGQEGSGYAKSIQCWGIEV